MAKNKFSKDWIHQHINDPYVKLAQQKGYRAGGVQAHRDPGHRKLMRRGDLVVDLGSAPGSWSQVARERRGRAGSWTGASSPWTSCPWSPWRGGIHPGRLPRGRSPETMEEMVGSRAVDLVISDMAPVRGRHRGRRAHPACLRAGDGVFLRPSQAQWGVDSQGFPRQRLSQIVQSFKQRFKRVVERKPKASGTSPRKPFWSPVI